MKSSAIKLSSALLSKLTPRTREVVERRFGLRKRDPETLEAVGKSFGITRERVRQIEADGLTRARESTADPECSAGLRGLCKDWERHLRKHGGLRQENKFIEEVGGGGKYHVLFLLAMGDFFHRSKESENLQAFWALNHDAVVAAKRTVKTVSDVFEKTRKAMNEKELLSLCNKELHKTGASLLDRNALLSHLDVFKDVSIGPHGLWGLSEWPEIRPRGLRDRAYLVYQKEKKPLHFTEVARLISVHGFAAKARPVMHQSVHNDLIRDPRFVLVGRGMYALSEWGYKAGAVREVIADAIREAKKPLSKEEIISRVLRQRQVKDNTVLINLQNSKCFARTADGKYKIASDLESTLV